MYRWSGKFSVASLPERIERDLRQQATNALNRYGSANTEKIVDEIVEEVSFAYAGRHHGLKGRGAGRPPNGTRMLLSSNLADQLEKQGIRGNWQTWPGQAGPIAELEAIAQTALLLASGENVGALTRPARVSEARKVLGKVYRNDPLPKSDPNN